MLLITVFFFSCATENKLLYIQNGKNNELKNIQKSKTSSNRKIKNDINKIEKVELSKIQSKSIKKNNDKEKTYNKDDVVFEFRKERYLEGIDTKDINDKINLTQKALQATFKMLSKAPSTGMEHLRFNPSPQLENINYNFKNYYLENNLKEKKFVESTVLVLLPLSNKFRVFGEKLRKSIDLGILEVKNSIVKYIYFDTGINFSLENLNRIIKENKPKLIIGPLLRETLIKIEPLIKNHNIPVISFTNDTTLSSNGIWTLGYSPYEQIRKIIYYSIKCKKKKVGFISVNNHYGKTIYNLVINKKNSYQIKDVLFINPETVKNKEYLNETLSKFLNYDKTKEKITQVNSKYELIFIIGDRNFILEVVPVLTYYDLDLKSTDLFSTSVLNEKTLLNEHSLINAKFPFISEKNINMFDIKWRKIWKNSKSDHLTRLGYYVSKISIWAASQNVTFENLINDKKNKFSILGNKFTFLPKGKVLRPSVIYKVNSSGKAVKVKNCK